MGKLARAIATLLFVVLLVSFFVVPEMYWYYLDVDGFRFLILIAMFLLVLVMIAGGFARPKES
jgi:uncharacterized membrane protein YphA (DoxX/SURF4 family)